MLEKIIIIYKGDKLTSLIYLIVGGLLTLIGLALYLFTTKIGFQYLSFGMMLFGILGLGKGILLYRVANSRKRFYEQKSTLSNDELKEEYDYTSFRLTKKARNRRRYAWTVVLTSFIALCGIFVQEKGLIMGTMIPIALYAGIEFGIGLLVEFRLWEYFRHLSKSLGISMED